MRRARLRSRRGSRHGRGKRWVVVRPKGATETALLLARAADAGQAEAIGRQAGGRVGFFLHTDDFARPRRLHRRRRPLPRRAAPRSLWQRRRLRGSVRQSLGSAAAGMNPQRNEKPAGKSFLVARLWLSLEEGREISRSVQNSEHQSKALSRGNDKIGSMNTPPVCCSTRSPAQDEGPWVRAERMALGVKRCREILGLGRSGWSRQ